MKKNVILLIVVLLILSLSGCGGNQPILIGLSVELTGRQADVGINVRDAALMAVDEINAAGGVNGRPIELIVRDDQGNPDVARQVDAELIEMGVVAIIGHYTSGQTEAVMDMMNEAEVVLLSPSASSSEFSGQKDYFFRLISDTAFIGQKMGEHIVSDHDINKLVGVYDDNNRSFAQSYWNAVRDEFTARGGETETIIFNTMQSDLQMVADEIKDTDPDGVVIAASAVDAAVMTQYMRQAGLDVPIFSAPWAQTNQLIEKGGQAVEGLEISGLYNANNRVASHLVFVQKFFERFGREPQLGTSQAYECILVLAEALRSTGGQREGLPDALYAIKEFPGILGTITFDEYGDVHREIYIMRVENGQFVEKTTIIPSTP